VLSTRGGSDGPPAWDGETVPDPSADALLGLLDPAWQALIAVCLLLVTVLGIWRLLRRGPARMTSAMLFTGLLVIVITIIGALVVSCSAPEDRHIPDPRYSVTDRGTAHMMIT
jgi:hypothetical protein